MAKILLVDDSKFTRAKIANHLKQNGFDIIEAEDGSMGLAAAKDEQPDCIVSDLLMPVMDGYGLLESLRAEGLQIPVIVMTADIQETTKKRVLDLGARALVNKPPNYGELAGLITKLLGETGGPA